ncbi:MAG: hypothetical protein KF894_08970 [Labilithrix sp.]|nr:hypothetical protein [Labilithrix sp.]
MKKIAPSAETEAAQIEETRQRWIAEWENEWRRLYRVNEDQHDEVARKIRGPLPLDIQQARELEEVATRCRRILERHFLFPEGSTEGVDPYDDARAARDLVPRLMKIVDRHGPSPYRLRDHMESWTETLKIGFDLSKTLTVQHYKSREPHLIYADISSAQQRRWRVAFMRYLDECAAMGWEWVPRSAEDLDVDTESASFDDDGSAEAVLVRCIFDLPFDLTAFPQDLLDRLMTAWLVKRAGAKATDAKIAGKWRMLSALLSETWGCKAKARALESEYGRFSTSRGRHGTDR